MMAWLRAGYPLKYVEGNSDDYVYLSDEGMVDYGHLSNKGLVELIADELGYKEEREDDQPIEFRNYLVEKIAYRLNVKLRQKPLTINEQFEIDDEIRREEE